MLQYAKGLTQKKGFVMIDSRLMTIQQYAMKYQLSTFAVIKQINSGKLKTIKEMVNGEEQELVIDEAVSASSSAPQQVQVQAQPAAAPARPTFLKSDEAIQDSQADYKIRYQELLEQYNELLDYKMKYEELSKKYDKLEQKARYDELLMNSM